MPCRPTRHLDTSREAEREPVVVPLDVETIAWAKRCATARGMPMPAWIGQLVETIHHEDLRDGEAA